MEFRIAPLILVIINCLLLSYNAYGALVNNNTPTLKAIGVSALILLLANGAYRGHHFLSKPYKLSFWILFIVDASILVALIIKAFK